jgi:SAM-dependent methyltransferase
MMPQKDPGWPDDWADLYDLIDTDRTPYRRFYRALVRPETGSLLDLACGTGSITLAMVEGLPPGARVTGVDLSPGMIRAARARAPDLDWVIGDMCDPPVEGHFDLVTICFHSLQILLDPADFARCLWSAAQHLAPQGRLAFDIYQPNIDWLMHLDPTPVVVRKVQDALGRTLEVLDGGAAYDPATRVLSSHWTLREADTGKTLPLAPLHLAARQYDPSEVEAHLDAAGLAIVERFGDFDRRPFGPGTIRQIYVCTKP